MTDFDLSLWLLTLAGLAIGVWSIYWVRSHAQVGRALWGRRLFLLALLELGGTAVAATLTLSLSLAPMGLVSVFLVVAMLWESPATQWQQD